MAALAGDMIVTLELESQGRADSNEAAMEKARRTRPRILAICDQDRLEAAALMPSVEEVADRLLPQLEPS